MRICPTSIWTSGVPILENCRLKDTANKAIWLTPSPRYWPGSAYICSITARPRLLSVTESMCSRLNQAGGPMPDTPKFDVREWLVPPVLLPIFIVLLVAASVVAHWNSIFN
jgi:hypothetical protein